MTTDPLRRVADADVRRVDLRVPVAPPLDLPAVDGLLAGVAEVDITPPPGMPKAGHSRNAQDGTGFRTRLKVRVLHLRAGTASVALVACDLLSGSAIVHHLVAHRIAEATDVRLPGLFLGATHTHAGPGQFSGSEFYNHWASNRPGFDPAWTDFLVDRISGAVIEAVRTRRPARLAFGTTDVWGFTRNRSLPAFVRNDNVADKRTEAQRKYTAVNPALHLVRVDEAEGGPLGAFVWFSIHGTGISHSDTSYNADVWAYITGDLAQRVEAATGQRPVVGAVEGTHGDMTPAVRPGMLVFHEAERVGRGIAAAAAGLHASLEPSHSSSVSLSAGLRELDLATHPEVDGIVLPGPRIGIAKLAGAVENTTPVVDKLPLFRPGMPKLRDRGPQGVKRVVGTDLVHTRINPDEDFPLVLPIQLLRIDDVGVLGLPFEITVESGRRIAAAVESAGIGTAVVSSLANDHCDYLTTPEEYGAQFYEGASTLFGPKQLEFVCGCARRLASEMVRDEAVADVSIERRFEFTVRRYLARPTGRSVTRVLDEPTFTEATAREDAYWELTWSDVAPGDLHWHEPLVRVETEDGKVVADDAGYHLGVTYLGGRGGHRYAARWYAPPLGRPGRHRFVLPANGLAAEAVSTPFD
ncbi:MAG: neutral/alkaline non-lysosomal ceramidase N-terminal domain-containing protein [Jatrophihabitans sp.]|uniref:neutral/alkaline non-lysosomal ceramidase N-terminal domain-containing protein n=1 Tax=Jatrophihabitans sp. TaxID=1932789 RepID=UPI003F7DC9B8